MVHVLIRPLVWNNNDDELRLTWNSSILARMGHNTVRKKAVRVIAPILCLKIFDPDRFYHLPYMVIGNYISKSNIYFMCQRYGQQSLEHSGERNTCGSCILTHVAVHPWLPNPSDKLHTTEWSDVPTSVWSRA